MTPAVGNHPLEAPFPYFGGKSTVAALVWERFGNVPNYVEPFFGSGAMLLGRPHAPRTETVNDKDGFIANFWRALQSDHEQVADHADWPVNENDLHARHAWLVGQKESMQARLEGDPEWFDARVAGWWVWGISSWIGSGFCSGNGPWQVIDGQLVHAGDAEQGVNRQLAHVGTARQGVNRKRVHAGTAGRGVNRKCVHAGKGELLEWFSELAERLSRVRVCCGDDDLYRVDCGSVAHDVRTWAIEQGANPLMRIALCGYEGEHQLPGWHLVPWKARGGFSSQNKEGNDNCRRERIWFSPYCEPSRQGELFT